MGTRPSSEGLRRVVCALQGDDELLVASVGAPQAFAALSLKLGPDIWKYLARRQPDAADDLLAETWLQAYASRKTFDPTKGSARGWLFVIARNVLFTYLRRSSAEARISPPIDTLELSDDWVLVDERLAADAVSGRLRAALKALAPPEREMLALVAWDQLTPSEAAEVLGIPQGTARSRLHRAKARMRDHLLIHAGLSPEHADSSPVLS